MKSFESIVTLRERPLSSPFIGPDMEEGSIDGFPISPAGSRRRRWMQMMMMRMRGHPNMPGDHGRHPPKSLLKWTMSISRAVVSVSSSDYFLKICLSHTGLNSIAPPPPPLFSNNNSETSKFVHTGLLLVLPRFALPAPRGHLLLATCSPACLTQVSWSACPPPACLDKICPVHEHTRDCPGHP